MDTLPFVDAVKREGALLLPKMNQSRKNSMPFKRGHRLEIRSYYLSTHARFNKLLVVHPLTTDVQVIHRIGVSG